MPIIESIVRQINREFVPQFEEKLRAYLADQDREWLIEQIVRLTLDAHSLEEMDRRHIREEENRRRAQRTERVKKLNLDQAKLDEFIGLYKGYGRERLVKENYLQPRTPAKGKELISDKFRSVEGTELLQHSKDMLFALLFGDESNNRAQRHGYLAGPARGCQRHARR